MRAAESAVQLNIWGNDLAVVSSALLLLAAQKEAGLDLQESHTVPDSVQLILLASVVALLGNSIAAFAASRAATVPPGQIIPGLAVLDIIASWLAVVSALIALEAAVAAYREGLTAAAAR